LKYLLFLSTGGLGVHVPGYWLPQGDPIWLLLPFAWLVLLLMLSKEARCGANGNLSKMLAGRLPASF
jgi:hypothetical protein